METDQSTTFLESAQTAWGLHPLALPLCCLIASHRPLAFMAGQALYWAAPLAGLLGWRNCAQWATLISDPGRLQQLETLLQTGKRPMNVVRQPAVSVFAAEWQLQLDEALELGRAPLLDLGATNGPLEGLPAVVALQAFMANRRDALPCTVLIGGNSVLWLAALWHDRRAAEAAQPTLVDVTYSGGDWATHIASVATHSAEAADPPTPAALPSGYAAFLAPSAHAGVTLWEAWPLAVRQTAGETAGDPWLVWSALLLVVVLLFLPFIV